MGYTTDFRGSFAFNKSLDTETKLRNMDDDQLMEIAVEHMGLGALAEPGEIIETQAERDSLIATILDAVYAEMSDLT